jgi:hypothetical protein
LNLLKNVASLALGSWPRQKLAKVRAKSEGLELHFMLMGAWESVREWTSTLSNELPLWELESRWTPKSSKNDCMGQKSLDWRNFYIIGNLLERRHLKWDHMTHWGTWNTRYGQKKGRESNCQFDYSPLKDKSHHDFLAFRCCARHCWKALDEGYNFVSHLISIRGLHTKLCASKVTKVLILGISKIPFGSPGTKWHLGVGPVAKHREYYKGEGGCFPQVWAMVNLVSPWLPVVYLCTKSAPTMH